MLLLTYKFIVLVELQTINSNQIVKVFYIFQITTLFNCFEEADWYLGSKWLCIITSLEFLKHVNMFWQKIKKDKINFRMRPEDISWETVKIYKVVRCKQSSKVYGFVYKNQKKFWTCILLFSTVTLTL